MLEQVSSLQPKDRPADQVSLSMPAGLLLTLILSIFAIAPLFYPGYIQTHSGFVPFWNIVDLRANFGHVTWTPHIFTTFTPLRAEGLLPYYLAALLPFAPAIALKLVIGISWLLGGAGMYLWLRSWLGTIGALVAALVYVYLPFQIAAVYVRGAWAEVLFWGVLPWTILATTYLVTSPRWLRLPVVALFWLFAGLTQLGLSLWAALFVTALLLVVHWRHIVFPLLSMMSGLIVAGLIALPLAAWPLAGAPLTDHLLYPFQLFSADWGFGSSRAGWNDGLSLQVGLAALGLTMISLARWQRSNSPVSRGERRLIFFVAAAVVLGLVQLIAPVWDLPGVSNILSYPWQVLGLVGFCLAVLAGALPWVDSQFTRLPLLGAVIIVIILSVYPYLLPRFLPTGPLLVELPKAELGEGQLALLDYNFETEISSHTVGLERDSASIPLEVYGQLNPGDSLIVNVAWQPVKSFDADLKVFVHLADSTDRVVAQFDGQPQEGDYPTGQWIPGEIIEDTYRLSLPADAPAGPYRIFIGLYNEATLERLPVPTDSAGRVIFDVR